LALSPDKLFRTLNYSFNDLSLAELALTHRSIGSANNERLEFLGDAILGAVIAEILFQRHPKAAEGDLTRLRAALVKGTTLAELGQKFNLGDYIRLGSGELKSGGFRRESILACAIEALIGAVYLDAGFEASRDFILALYEDRLDEVSPESVQKDPKTRLQEFLQARKQPLPEYELEKLEGEPHAQIFYVKCRLPGLEQEVSGQGGSRRKAEQLAAEEALSILSAEQK
jgi:ribonuclease-3